MAVELPRTIANEILCISHSVSRLSLVESDNLEPRSFRNAIEDGPIAPDVSTATGSKMYLSVRAEYLATFRASAFLAADEGSVAYFSMLEGAKESQHVASHMSGLPCLNGKSVMPSGLLPSPRSSPDGSREEGKPAEVRARRTMSFRAA